MATGPTRFYGLTVKAFYDNPHEPLTGRPCTRTTRLNPAPIDPKARRPLRQRKLYSEPWCSPTSSQPPACGSSRGLGDATFRFGRVESMRSNSTQAYSILFESSIFTASSLLKAYICLKETAFEGHALVSLHIKYSHTVHELLLFKPFSIFQSLYLLSI